MNFTYFIRKLINFLKRVYLIFKNFSLWLGKIFLKFNIQLVYSIVTNTLVHSIYMFLQLYGYYGWKIVVPCPLSNIIAIYIVIYSMLIFLFLALIYHITFTKTFLENLIGKDYVVKYLGHLDSLVPQKPDSLQAGYFTSMLPSLNSAAKMAGAAGAVVACEIMTSYCSQQMMLQRQEAITDLHKMTNGDAPSQWEKGEKKAFHKAQDANRATHTTGTVEKIISNEHKQELANTASKTVGTLARIMPWVPRD